MIMDIQEHLPQLKTVFETHGVVLGYLFGSQAQGTAGPLSDLDIAVLLSPEVPRERWPEVQIKLICDLMSVFHHNDVDVIILNRAPALLAYEAARYGKVIYQDASQPHLDFLVLAISRYADTRRLRDIFTAYLLERAGERAALRSEVLVEAVV